MELFKFIEYFYVVTYKNPPIIEAVLDIRVSGFENESFKEFADRFDEMLHEYPQKRILNSLQGSFIFNNDTSEPTKEITSDCHGVVFSKSKETRQVQFRRDGFTYNLLAPYTNWNELKIEASKLWEVYIKEFANVKIERMALRYINRIVIPKSDKLLKDYILSIPPIPNSLPQLYKSFFSQVEVPCDHKNCFAIINTTIQTSSAKEISVILDIDVYKSVVDHFNFNDFDYIRELKNSIFESCITESTRLLF